MCWWINDRVLFFICFFSSFECFFLLLFLFFHFAKLCCLLAHRWTLNCAKCIQTYWSLDEHWMKFKRPTRIYISKALHDMNEKHEENHERRKTHTTERRTNNNNKLETLVCKLNWLCHAKHVLHIYTQKYSVLAIYSMNECVSNHKSIENVCVWLCTFFRLNSRFPFICWFSKIKCDRT